MTIRREDPPAQDSEKDMFVEAMIAAVILYIVRMLCDGGDASEVGW
jgi:hypothetical protein